MGYNEYSIVKLKNKPSTTELSLEEREPDVSRLNYICVVIEICGI